jgi:hypothetical protein
VFDSNIEEWGLTGLLKNNNLPANSSFSLSAIKSQAGKNGLRLKHFHDGTKLR